tara:strand:+ start:179 stop:766 length:588 start_codon:yes stop_codon:yes gene_type:complete
MQIEHLHVKTLIPYVNNAREHSEEQVDQIAASIKKFKFNNPVLVDKTHGIIAGHGRVLAAMRLGLETVPCIRLDHLSETEKKAYILADNQIALNSTYNYSLVNAELQELENLDFDTSVTGFDIDDLAIKQVDYSVLDNSENVKLQELERSARRAIEITFTLEDYPTAYEVLSYAKTQDSDLGMTIVNFLQKKYQS